MSISVNREDSDGLIEWSESVASTDFFVKCWDPAISELGIKYFQENGYFDRAQLSIVMKELDAIKDWAMKNLNDNESSRVRDTVIRLKKAIPEAFKEHEDKRLYIY